MTLPVGPRTSPLDWGDYYPPIEQLIKQPAVSKDEETKSAEAEIASLYYRDTIQTAQPPLESTRSAKIEATVIQPKRTIWRKIKDWVSDIFGKGKKDNEAERKELSEIQGSLQKLMGEPLDATPQLAAPDDDDADAYMKIFKELNQDLIYSAQETAAFEEELRKASIPLYEKTRFKDLEDYEHWLRVAHRPLEAFINKYLIKLGIAQKGQKELSIIEAHEELMRFHKRNKNLEKVHFSLLEDIATRKKTNKILHWVNVGQTAATVGITGAVIFTGGMAAPLAIALPLMSISKAILTMTQGLLNKKQDKKTGELFIVKQDIKMNNNSMNERLSNTQSSDEEIGTLLKMIRHQIDDQQYAAQQMNKSK